MINYISAEFLKIRKSLAFKILLIASFATGLLQFLSLLLISVMYNTDEMIETLKATYLNQGYTEAEADVFIDAMLNPKGSSVLTSCLDGANLILLIGIFVCIFVTSDYSNGTIRQITSRGLSKIKVLCGKFIVSFTSSLLFTALIILGGYVTTCVVYEAGDAPDNLPIYVLKFVVIVLLANLAYTSIAYFLSIVTKHMGISIIGIVAISLLGDVVVILLNTAFKNKYAIENYWLTSSPVAMANFSTKTSDYLKYGCPLLIVAALFIGLSVLVFSKQEN